LTISLAQDRASGRTAPPGLVGLAPAGTKPGRREDGALFALPDGKGMRADENYRDPLPDEGTFGPPENYVRVCEGCPVTGGRNYGAVRQAAQPVSEQVGRPTGALMFVTYERLMFVTYEKLWRAA